MGLLWGNPALTLTLRVPLGPEGPVGKFRAVCPQVFRKEQNME